MNRAWMACLLLLTACSGTADVDGLEDGPEAPSGGTGSLPVAGGTTTSTGPGGGTTSTTVSTTTTTHTTPGTPTTSTTVGTDVAPATEGGVRLGYLYVTDGSLADPSYPSDAQIARLTHVNVSFFSVTERGGGLSHAYDPVAFGDFLDRLRAQTNRYGVKMVAAAGGWGFANPTAEGFCNYVDAAASPASRSAFADAAKAELDGMCDNGGLPCFDGFDLDVEYIGQSVDGGLPCSDGDLGAAVGQIPDFERARAFRDLLIELRGHFDVLTIAGPGALYSLKFSWSVMREVSETVDYINVMAYDYTGVWTQNDVPLDTTQPGCEADTEQCWGCGYTLAPVVDHHNALHGSQGAPGYYNFLCDSSEAIEAAVVCDPWGSGTIAPGTAASAAVCVNPYVLSASKVVAMYTMGIGVDPGKLVLGVGFYGRAFRNVNAQGGLDAPGARAGLRQHFGGMCLNEGYCWGDEDEGIAEGSCRTPDGIRSCEGAPDHNWLTGFTFDTDQPDPRAVSYDQIASVCPEVSDLSGLSDVGGPTLGVACATAGWRAYYDDQAEVPWLHHAADDLVVSFDSPRSIAAKGDWALSQGLAGLMFWQLNQDTADLALLDALHGSMVE